MSERKIGFGKQITLLIITVSVLIFSCSVFVAMLNVRKSLLQVSEKRIDDVTELAYNILDGYKKRVDSGELTLQEAQTLALKDLRNFKYDGKNYVWVMDYNCKYFYHPTRAVGFDGKKLKDSTGRHYITELTENAKSGKTIFIRNSAIKPGDPSKKMYPKLSKGKTFADWQWVVATGIYIDEIDHMMISTFISIFLINLIAIIFIIIVANQSVIKKLLSRLNNISIHLKETSGQLEEAAFELETSSQKLAEGSAEQASAIQETSATIEETSSMVQQNNENTKHAATLAKNTKHYTNESTDATQKMMATMNKLEGSSKEISKIIKTIDEIAFQTNILSLNAAVEAARAGDAGKGFAVVAEEVRTLAQRSAQAAKDTTTIIESNINLSIQGIDMAKQVEDSLLKIDEEVNKVNELLDEISTATHEQSQGVEQINKAVSQMEQVLQSNASEAEHTSASSRELSSQVSSMNNIVDDLSSIVHGHN